MVFETIRFGRSRIPPGGQCNEPDRVRRHSCDARRPAKNPLSRRDASSARTPLTTRISWLRRGSAATL